MPATHKAAVVVPQPRVEFLAVFKSPTSVQFVPSYCSVSSLLVGDCPPTVHPPKANAAVCVPAPPHSYFAVPKLFPSVHDEPSYSSEFVTTGPEA